MLAQPGGPVPGKGSDLGVDNDGDDDDCVGFDDHCQRLVIFHPLFTKTVDDGPKSSELDWLNSLKAIGTYVVRLVFLGGVSIYIYVNSSF